MTAGPRTAASSIRLVLSVVPWIIDHPGSSIDEIAERFGQKPSALMKTLEMLSFVGVPPYSPDALIEVRFEGDRVWINFADYFSKPLQLSTGQALALLAAADALRRIEGADPDGLAFPFAHTTKTENGWWVNTTSIPMVLAARPLWALGGPQLILLIPIMAAAGAAVVAVG